MIRASEARREAREALNGKWKKAFLIALLYALFLFAVGFVIGFIGAFVGALGVLLRIGEIVITPPLTYGLAYSYYHLKNGEDVGYGDFLKVGFENFGLRWGIAWRIFCKCWYLILIPVVVFIVIIVLVISYGASESLPSNDDIKKESYLSTSYSTTPYDYYYYGDDDYYDYDNDYDYYNDYNYDYDNDYDYDYDNDYNDSNSNTNSDKLDVVSSMLLASSVILILGLVGFIVYIIILIVVIRKLLLYALSYYIAVANENKTPREAVQESEDLMKGNRGRLFCLMLSFIGWGFLIGILSMIVGLGGILGIIILYVGTALLTPYMTFAILAFYRDLVGGNNNPNSYVNAPGSGQVNFQSTTNNMSGNVQMNNSGMQNGYQMNNNAGINPTGYQINPNGNNSGYQMNTNTTNTGNIGYQANINPVENQSNTTPVNQPENQVENSPLMQNINNQVQKRYCARCGAENSADATYCTNCGAKLN